MTSIESYIFGGPCFQLSEGHEDRIPAVSMEQPRVNSPVSVRPAPTLERTYQMGGRMQEHACEAFPIAILSASMLIFLYSFLYTLFLAMDANFKLKGKDRGITDLETTPGWSYCVNEHKYQQYLINFADEEEVSNLCLSFLCLNTIHPTD
jgi:hypothetical protein